uniref:Uncharacterized protein n=1 Tax=Romanomermis culicivorax TaxID=13658 RepID=A0A915L3M2_ROMCU
MELTEVQQFNDVTISFNDNVEGKVGAREVSAASFDWMGCIWRSISKLPALEELNTRVGDQKSELQKEEQASCSLRRPHELLVDSLSICQHQNYRKSSALDAKENPHTGWRS